MKCYKAVSTEKGWNDLKFIIHNAKLTSNAKEQIEKKKRNIKKQQQLE